MNKMTDNAPFFEHDNNVNQNNSPIGYPNMDQRDPKAAGMLQPPTRVYVENNGPYSRSYNPQRESQMKWSPASELKRMKLAK